MELERVRGREKFKRLGYKDRFKSVTKICPKEKMVSQCLEEEDMIHPGKKLIIGIIILLFLFFF